MLNMLKRTVASGALMLALTASTFAQGVPTSNPEGVAKLLDVVRLSIIELGIETCTPECGNADGAYDKEADQQIQKGQRTEPKS